MEIKVSAVAFQDEGIWIAQCLEYDIVATAETMSQLPKALERAVVANICVNADLGRQGLDGIAPAPAHFREMFESSQFPWRPIDMPAADSHIRDLRLVDAV